MSAADVDMGVLEELCAAALTRNREDPSWGCNKTKTQFRFRDKGCGAAGGAAKNGLRPSQDFRSMHDEKASMTALGVAFIRAAHQIFDTRPLLFEDPIALPLLGPGVMDVLEARREWLQTPYRRGMRSHVCLRSRFAEDRLAVAKADRYVLVGAGFDTFALRQPEWAKDLRILEIDHPATQAAKREKIAAAGLSVPPNLTFAPCDFTRETLADVLGREGVRRDETVYFSWLGVTMYLTREAIDASLAAMAAASARSLVCLTFKQHDDGSVPGAKEDAEFVASLGEAFVSYFTPDEMGDLLKSHGFATQEFLTPERATAEYYTPPRPGLPAPRKTAIVLAATSS